MNKKIGVVNEVKPGLKTTEFWIVLGIDILEGLRAALTGGLTWQEVLGIILLNAIYVIQRGFLKGQ